MNAWPLPGPWRNNPYRSWLGTIVAAGLGLRLAFLGHQPLWRDEAFTQLAARRGWLDMLDVVRHDSAPPLSYLLAHLVASVSLDPIALRLPAVIAGTAAIPLAAALGRRVGGERAALCSAALVAFMPTFVLSARDARMYALASTLTLAFVLCLWRAIDRPERGRLVTLALVSSAAVLTQYFAALAICGAFLAATVLGVGGLTRFRCALAIGLGMLPLLLWLPFAVPQLQHSGGGFWVPPLGGFTLLGVLTQFLCGPAVDADLPHHDLVVFLQAGTLILTSIGGAVTLVWALSMCPAQRRTAGYVSGSTLIAIAILIAIGIRIPLVDAKYASVLWPPLAIVPFGLGISRIRPRPLSGLALGAAAVASVALVWLPVRADVARLTANVHASGPDVVLADPVLFLQALDTADASTVARLHIPRSTIDWFWGTAVYPPGSFMPSLPANVGAVYALTTAAAPDPPLPLPAGYHQTAQWCDSTACLTLYSS